MASISNPNNRPIVYGTEGVEGFSIAIDYTEYYARIASALETLATNSTTIKNDIALIKDDIDTLATQVTTIATQTTTIANQTTTIASQTTTLAAQTTTIAAQQTILANKVTSLEALGAGSGIHVIGPYEYLGLVSIYRLLVEQGKALDSTENVSPEKQAQAIAQLQQYANKFNILPTSF